MARGSGRHPVRYLRLAEQDLYDIFDYVSKDNPGVVAWLMDMLTESIGGLECHPSRGRRARDPVLRERGYRTLSVEDYIAVYKIEDGEVIIYRVLHGARDWASIV